MISYTTQIQVLLHQRNDTTLNRRALAESWLNGVTHGSPEIRTQDQSVKSRVLYR